MQWAKRINTYKKTLLPRDIRLRPGVASDEFQAFEVMRRTMGYEMAWAHHESTRNHLRESPNCSFWLAEERGHFGGVKIVGYARSIVREKTLCLTEFFVLPGYHRKGIGNALLTECIRAGDEAGATSRMVLASHHPGANSLYVRKFGCTPRVPMMLLAGPLSRLRLPPELYRPIKETYLPFAFPPVNAANCEKSDYFLRAEPMILTPQIESRLSALDREIVGHSRTIDHRFWASTMGGAEGSSRLFRKVAPTTSVSNGTLSEKEADIVGYAYLGGSTSGPALALNASDLPGMLTHVSILSRSKVDADDDNDFILPTEQYWAIAGTNEVVLKWLLNCGWEITFHYLLMSTAPIGRPENYVGNNPLYLL